MNFSCKYLDENIREVFGENNEIMDINKYKKFLAGKQRIHDLKSYDIKVSIIVPVYNIENYLRECLDSVVNQTLKEIEIICVNDGSTDNSPLILEEYAIIDDRIRIINKENAGLAAARNTGMEYAKGEYIGFVDSDDYVDVSMFEKLYNNAKFHDSDIVMCPILVVNENYEELNNRRSGDIFPYYDLDCFDEDFNDCVFDFKKTENFIFKIAVSGFNKIYRTEFINKIDAKFPEGLIFEDGPFFYRAYLKAKNCSLIRDYLYFYRVNRLGSIMSNGDRRFFDIIEIRNLITKIFESLPNFEDYKIEILNKKLMIIVERYFQVSDNYRQEFYELIREDFEKMNLENDTLDALNSSARSNYLNAINSNSYREFELSVENDRLLNRINNLVVRNRELLKNNNKLQMQMESNGIERKKILDENASKTIAVKVGNIKSYVYIIFNKNNNGIKNAFINIKGYRAIKKHNLVDIGYYLRNNDDVRQSGMDPILHYMYHGFKEGRKPNPLFDGELYLEKYGDVKSSNLNPLVHYSLYGIQEGRKTSED